HHDRHLLRRDRARRGAEGVRVLRAPATSPGQLRSEPAGTASARATPGGRRVLPRRSPGVRPGNGQRSPGPGTLDLVTLPSPLITPTAPSTPSRRSVLKGA